MPKPEFVHGECLMFPVGRGWCKCTYITTAYLSDEDGWVAWIELPETKARIDTPVSGLKAYDFLY